MHWMLLSFLAGVAAILLGYIAGFIVRPFLSVDLPDVCRGWNRKFVMEATLFIVGWLLYLVMRYIAMNGSSFL